MSRSLNEILLVGNLGKPPEMSATKKGTVVARFSVATNRRWKDENGERQEVTEWHNVVCFGALAEIVEGMARTGSRVLVKGDMRYGSYEKEGHTFRTAQVHASEVIFLDPPMSRSA